MQKSYSLGELIFQLSYHVVSALGHAKEDVQSQRLSSRDLISLCQTRRFGEREAFWSLESTTSSPWYALLVSTIKALTQWMRIYKEMKKIACLLQRCWRTGLTTPSSIRPSPRLVSRPGDFIFLWHIYNLMYTSSKWHCTKLFQTNIFYYI